MMLEKILKELRLRLRYLNDVCDREADGCRQDKLRYQMRGVEECLLKIQEISGSTGPGSLM